MNAKTEDRKRKKAAREAEEARRVANNAGYREGVESARIYSPVNMSKSRNPHARNYRERKLNP